MNLRSPFLVALCCVVTASWSQNAAPPWSVRAILPDGRSIPVQAFDPKGVVWPVMAVEDGNTHLLHVRAIGKDSWVPVKMLVSDEAFLPVKAIGPDGAVWDVKAVTPEGLRMDVKGVSRAGHIVHIKAIGPALELYGVKAISTTGRFHDVKGVRMGTEEVEAVLNGNRIFAHVKALPQALNSAEEPIWNIKAIAADGSFLPVKATDAKGGIHDVKAFMENGDRWIMDVKAIINGRKVPVKMLVSSDPLVPVKAIDGEGTIYGIKALAEDGSRLDVKGTQQAGNIIHLKAIMADGRQLGVKAISPQGAQYDVKGLKFTDDVQETHVGAVEVKAHVKAIPPAEQ